MKQIYSHPGKLLKDHSMNVMRLGLTNLHTKKIESVHLNLELFTQIVLVSHDFGKATSFFQNRLLTGDQSDARANHGQLSGLFTHYLLEQLIGDSLTSILGYCIVTRHHGNLKNFHDLSLLNQEELQVLEEQFQSMELLTLQDILQSSDINLQIDNLTFSELLGNLEPQKFRRNWRKIRRSKLGKVENYPLINLVYSLLISSDKAEAIFYSNNLDYTELERIVLCRTSLSEDIIDTYKQLQGWNEPGSLMNQMRNRIYDDVLTHISQLELSKKVLSINVPTGTGKTLTALSAALHLRERISQKVGTVPRIIYTLPFTSIIDQNYEVFFEAFKTVGIEVDQKILLKHHHLTPKVYRWNEEYDDQYPDVSEYLVETWNAEIIVTTFVQFLHTVFSNQNRSLKKFHQLANSIILLDEVQSIPHHYWTLVQTTLQVLSKVLNCYFILITATMPLIFNESAGEIYELAHGKREYFNFFDRIKLNISRFSNPLTISEFNQMLKADLENYSDQSFLIVLNTIGTSLQVFNYLKKEVALTNLIYLSTNIIPKHRLERINQIKESKEPCVIVSTQMIEAGVDIDIDRVYRDFGPLDALNQTCGRCNRNFDDSRKGEVILVNLVNENHNNVQYGHYVYGEFLLAHTKEVLKGLPEEIAEKDFLDMNMQYFKRVNAGKSNDRSISILKRMDNLEYKYAFEDDSDINEGKSAVFRLIEDDQKTVNLFIEIDGAEEIWKTYESLFKLKDPFVRKVQFEKIKGEFLSYVITIPERVVKKHLDSNQLEHVFNRIPLEQLNGVYDLNTGFIRDITEVNLFF